MMVYGTVYLEYLLFWKYHVYVYYCVYICYETKAVYVIYVDVSNAKWDPVTV